MPLLSIADLASHLSVSGRHLERCAAAGMPSVAVGARLAWLADHAQETSA